MRSLPFLLVSILTLSACSSGTSRQPGDPLNNPLVAARYGDELADTMANLVIRDDPAAKDPVFREIIDAKIAVGKKMATDAREKLEGGAFGFFTTVKEDTLGFALLLDATLYLSSDFFTKPGPDVHVYLTTVTDPGESVFPDATAVDLGSLKTVYGSHEYRVPSTDHREELRTVVIWDKALKRTYGFSQLSRR